MLKGLQATYELRKFAHFGSDSILDTQNKQILKINRQQGQSFFVNLIDLYTKWGYITVESSNNHESS